MSMACLAGVTIQIMIHAGVVLRRFSALHCALAREFVLPLKTTTEVCTSVPGLVPR